jgi:hypothetical protein
MRFLWLLKIWKYGPCFFVCGNAVTDLPLSHVQTFQKHMKGSKQEPQEQDTPKMARPFQAIPMPYSPLSPQKENEELPEISGPVLTGTTKKKKKERGSTMNATNKTKGANVRGETAGAEDGAGSSPKALLCKSKTEALPTWQQPENEDRMSWSIHLKTLLYEKACLVYVTLAESDYIAENYGMKYLEIHWHA